MSVKAMMHRTHRMCIAANYHPGPIGRIYPLTKRALRAFLLFSVNMAVVLNGTALHLSCFCLVNIHTAHEVCRCALLFSFLPP